MPGEHLRPPSIAVNAGFFQWLLGGGLIFIALWVCIYVALGLTVSAIVEVAWGGVVAIGLVWQRRQARWPTAMLWAQILALYGVATVQTVLQGGIQGSAGAILWGYVCPLGAYVFLGLRACIGASAIYAVLVLGSVYIGLDPAHATPLPESLREGLLAINIVGSGALFLGTVAFFMRRLNEAQRMREHARFELLKVEQLETLGLLASGIAHDLNNILMAFAGNISLASRLADDPVRVRELLGRAEDALKHATHLSGRLLTFAAGGAPLREETSIAETLQESAAFSLHGSEIACAFDLQPDLWSAKVDLGQLSQVITNLVVNAAQATTTGGGSPSAPTTGP